MMRKLTLALFLFPALLASNARASGYVCRPDPHTSQMAVSWDTSKVTVVVENPRGYSAMPQLDFGLSEEMIPFAKMQIQDLRGLADSFAIEWKAENCKVTRTHEALFQCSGNGILKDSRGQPMTDIQALGVTSAAISEVSLDGPQRTYRLRFIFLKDGNTYFVSLPFPAPFCRGF